jgi:hypothetical protein
LSWEIHWAPRKNAGLSFFDAPLGNALGILSERDGSVVHLKEAIKAYQAALTEWTEITNPSGHKIAQQELELLEKKLKDSQSVR